MLTRIRRIHDRLIETHQVAAPASTLILVTLFAVGLGLVTRTAFAKPDAPTTKSWVSESTSPGQSIDVVVAGEQGVLFKAYLPGLTHRLVPLEYDASIGQHTGQIKVPSTAPNHGYCTLRIVGGSDHEIDHNVQLKTKSTEKSNQNSG